MKDDQLWKEFITKMHIDDCDYEAWAFGDDEDILARLVLAGEKTATSSAFALYEYEKEYVPAVGEYSVLLDSNEDAVCVLRTKSVSIVPFDEVTAEYAYRQGLQLIYWLIITKNGREINTPPFFRYIHIIRFVILLFN